MYKLFILSLFLITFQVTGLCQTIRKDSIKTNYIEFGSGGGFSGASKNYILTQSGELYKIKNILADGNTLTYLKKIKNRTLRKIFRYVEKEGIDGLTYNEPGNIYHYITISLNTKKNHLVWSDHNAATPEKIRILSIKLNNLLL